MIRPSYLTPHRLSEPPQWQDQRVFCGGQQLKQLHVYAKTCAMQAATREMKDARKTHEINLLVTAAADEA